MRQPRHAAQTIQRHSAHPLAVDQADNSTADQADNSTTDQADNSKANQAGTRTCLIISSWRASCSEAQACLQDQGWDLSQGEPS